jgi:hypothetical protein
MEAITKQMIDFQKSTFSNAYSAIVTIQEQAEKFTNEMMEQLPWITDDGKRMFSGMMENFKKSRETYKTSVLDGFEKIESMIS